MPHAIVDPDRRRVRAVTLVLLVGLAVAVRLWFALGPADGYDLPGDAVTYREMAHHLVEGEGLQLGRPGDGVPEPTAEHPPAFPLLLAGLDVVGLGSETGHRVGLAGVSSLAVALVALAGAEVGGRRVGAVAGLVAALHPTWVQPAAMVMSESLYLVVVSAVLWWALRGVRSRSALAVLGALVGLAAMVRPEGLGLLVVIAVPAVLRSGRRVLPALGTVLAVTCLAVVPWVVRNAARVDHPVLATNVGKTILGSSCDDTFSGAQLGGFSYDCQLGTAVVLVDARAEEGRTWTGAELDAEMGDRALDYVRDHLAEMPKIVAARVARTWGVGFLGAQLDFDVVEGRIRAAQQAAQLVHLLLLPVAAVGAIALRRRAGTLALLTVAGPLVLVTLPTILVYGGPRMRIAAEPSLALLGAVGASHLVGSLARALGPDRADAVPPR